MSSVVQTFKKRSNALPLSHTDSNAQTLRRRLSSLSLPIHPISSSPSSWPFPRSKSVSSMAEFAGSSVKKWWHWGWTWILTRKPLFAADLEINQEQTKILGSQSRGSWSHVLFKVRSQIRKLIGSDHAGLPQTYKYQSSNNFDNGGIRS